MYINLKNTVTSNIFLKISSLIIGYLGWSIISNAYHATMWITVPICFYNTSNLTIEAPETIFLELKGTRSQLRSIDKEKLSVFIDAKTLIQGPNACQITTSKLFLPPSIKIHNYIPINPVITVA